MRLFEWMDDCKVTTFSLIHFVYLKTEASKTTPLFFVQSVISCHVPLGLPRGLPTKNRTLQSGNLEERGIGCRKKFCNLYNDDI
jgi:hypothetical protein